MQKQIPRKQRNLSHLILKMQKNTSVNAMVTTIRNMEMCLTTAVLPFLQAARIAVSMFALICRFPILLYLRFTSFADLSGLLTVVTLYVWLSSISRPCTMPAVQWLYVSLAIISTVAHNSRCR